MPRALITGVTGQDGMYLSRLLVAKGYEVYGLVRGQNNPRLETIRAWAPTVPFAELVARMVAADMELVRARDI
jgi:GDPmannose 4,6-dehydratase